MNHLNRRSIRLPVGFTLFLFIVPAVIIEFSLVQFSILYSLFLSLAHWNLEIPFSQPQYVGLQNYLQIGSDTRVIASFVTTGIYCVAIIVSEFTVGLGLALLMNRQFKGQGVVRSILMMPMMITPVVVALIWRFMLTTPYGILSYLFEQASGATAPDWLGVPSLALFSVIIADIWQVTPFVFMILLAGVQSLPDEPFEAAKVDGASRWQVLRHVTLPLLRPAILVVLLIRTMDCFKEFDKVYIMTMGGPAGSTELASFEAFKMAFTFFDIGRGSALSWIILLIIAVISVLYLRIFTQA
jgi:multiple sugar transport system permease protein